MCGNVINKRRNPYAWKHQFARYQRNAQTAQRPISCTQSHKVAIWPWADESADLTFRCFERLYIWDAMLSVRFSGRTESSAFRFGGRCVSWLRIYWRKPFERKLNIAGIRIDLEMLLPPLKEGIHRTLSGLSNRTAFCSTSCLEWIRTVSSSYEKEYGFTLLGE